MPPSSLCQAVLGLPITPRLPLPFFFFLGGGVRPWNPLRAFMSRAQQHCSGNGPVSSWNHHSVFFLSFLPFFTPSLNLHLKLLHVGRVGRRFHPRVYAWALGGGSVHLRSCMPQRLASEREWNASSERTERLFVCEATAVFPMSIWKATKCQLFCHSTCSHTL